MLRFVWIIQSLHNTVKAMVVPACVAVWCGSPACHSRGRRWGCSTPAPWWLASDSGCACCSPAAWPPAPSPAACASCKADSFSYYSVPHNASFKADSFSYYSVPHNASCKADSFSYYLMPHTMPHARQRGRQLFLTATHNASCKAGRPLALPQCHTQCLMQGREAFSSFSVPYTMPHARQSPSALTWCHT